MAAFSTQPRYPAPCARPRLSALGAIACLLCAASDLASQERSAPNEDGQIRILGQVVDARTGAPLVGARVSVVDADWVSITNREGRFVLQGIGPGVHIVRVEHLGYHTLGVETEAAAAGDPMRIAIEPDPILLEGLEVVTRRFERRRRVTGVRVVEFDSEQLATTGYFSTGDLLAARIPAQRTRCTDGGFECIYWRGGTVRPTVYIDEAPMLDGWNALENYSPHEFHMIEVYYRGVHIRAYTHAFMERASRIRFLPVPIWSW